MQSMSSLFAPKAIAVVGASQRRGRGASTVANLKNGGFKGEIFAVNPRYDEVLGLRCLPNVASLPQSVDCLVVATAADTACDVLEEAFARGIRAAIVLAAGFGEGGHGAGHVRAARLASLAERGMSICGPNCMGLINVKAGLVAFSSNVPQPLRGGGVALISQSGGLGQTAFAPLMTDRALGFGYFVSCGNQIGVSIEDFVEFLVDDADTHVIAIVVESLRNPRKLSRLAQAASARRKTLVLFQCGRSAAGQVLIRSHTGALASDAAIFAAYLRRCGIVQAETFDEFVELIELFAIAPRDERIGDDVVVLAGSGGGAATAADVLARSGMPLTELAPATRERIGRIMPEFGSVTNPIDGTGAIYDDHALLPKIFDAVVEEPGRPIIAASVSARPVGYDNMQRLAGTIAEAARKSDRTFVAYSYSPLGGPLDPVIIATLHGAGIPYLLGITNAMSVLKYLPLRREHWRRATLQGAARHGAPAVDEGGSGRRAAFTPGGFMAARSALVAGGVPIVDVRPARSQDEAVEAFRAFAGPVAVKAEAAGLLHKSDLGCVRLRCDSEDAVVEAYRKVIANAHAAGFADATAIVQPMVAGVAEAYAGVIDDPVYGPAVCFGLGGIFVELFKDTTTELAPLTHDDAMRAIRRIKALPLIEGARGRRRGDLEALAALLVKLGDFALAHRGAFRSLDLNPIIVKPEGDGVVAVDIAAEAGNDLPAMAPRQQPPNSQGLERTPDELQGFDLRGRRTDRDHHAQSSAADERDVAQSRA